MVAAVNNSVVVQTSVDKNSVVIVFFMVAMGDAMSGRETFVSEFTALDLENFLVAGFARIAGFGTSCNIAPEGRLWRTSISCSLGSFDVDLPDLVRFWAAGVVCGLNGALGAKTSIALRNAPSCKNSKSESLGTLSLFLSGKCMGIADDDIVRSMLLSAFLRGARKEDMDRVLLSSFRPFCRPSVVMLATILATVSEVVKGDPLALALALERMEL